MQTRFEAFAFIGKSASVREPRDQELDTMSAWCWATAPSPLSPRVVRAPARLGGTVRWAPIKSRYRPGEFLTRPIPSGLLFRSTAAILEIRAARHRSPQASGRLSECSSAGASALVNYHSTHR